MAAHPPSNIPLALFPPPLNPQDNPLALQLEQFNAAAFQALIQERADWGQPTSQLFQPVTSRDTPERWDKMYRACLSVMSQHHEQQQPSTSPSPLPSAASPPNTSHTHRHSTLFVVSMALIAATLEALPILLGYNPQFTTPTQKIAAFCGILARAAIAAGAAVYLLPKLKKAFEAAAQAIIKISKTNGAESAARFTHLLAGASVAAGAAASVVGNAFIALFRYAQYRMAFTDTAREQYRQQLDQCLAPDELIRRFATALAVWGVSAATTTVLPALGAGATAAAVTFVIHAFVNSFMESIVERKNRVGSWSDWVRLFFVTDDRPREWRGMVLELNEDSILDHLKCRITHQLVVDPVCYVGGFGPHHLYTYERSALVHWLEERQSDPMSNIPATIHDYKRSPAAYRLVRQVAVDILDGDLVVA